MAELEPGANPPAMPFSSGHAVTCSRGNWHPKLKVKEYVDITADLESRLTSPKHIALFHKSSGRNKLEIGSKIVTVDLPHILNQSTNTTSERTEWRTVNAELLKLKAVCQSG